MESEERRESDEQQGTDTETSEIRDLDPESEDSDDVRGGGYIRGGIIQGDGG
jgi:hypothetical protein